MWKLAPVSSPLHKWQTINNDLFSNCKTFHTNWKIISKRGLILILVTFYFNIVSLCGTQRSDSSDRNWVTTVHCDFQSRTALNFLKRIMVLSHGIMNSSFQTARLNETGVLGPVFKRYYFVSKKNVFFACHLKNVMCMMLRKRKTCGM